MLNVWGRYRLAQCGYSITRASSVTSCEPDVNNYFWRDNPFPLNSPCRSNLNHNLRAPAPNWQVNVTAKNNANSHRSRDWSSKNRCRLLLDSSKSAHRSSRILSRLLCARLERYMIIIALPTGAIFVVECRSIDELYEVNCLRHHGARRVRLST